jgi:plastocyanin
MRRSALGGVAAAGAFGLGLAGGVPPVAQAMPMDPGAPTVTILGTAFAPGAIDVLAGDTVSWHNDSVQRHTVTAYDHSFASAPLFSGDMYDHRFVAAGDYKYFCTIHPFMQGEVDVHRVLLDAPTQPGAPNVPYTLAGRTALPAGSTVALERDAGTGFAPAGNATVGPDGGFAASVRSAVTASYRAVAGGETTPAVRLLIVNRSVSARAGRGVVTTRVTPASPHATVVLQLRLRDRFGWWPVAQKRLDRHSRARFVVRGVRRAVRARVVLTLSDGATALARSPVLHVRSRG